MSLKQVNKFIKAMERCAICELIDRKGMKRVVQPYGIFFSSHNELEYCTFQIEGYSESGKIPNWRNIKVSDIVKINILDQSFSIRKDYNPDNEMVYPRWEIKI